MRILKDMLLEDISLLQDVINVRRYVCKNVKMLKTLFERMLEVKVERMSLLVIMSERMFGNTSNNVRETCQNVAS